jgi:hypothetical protein
MPSTTHSVALTVLQNAVQDFLSHIPNSFEDVALTSPDITTLFNLLGKDARNFVPRARLEALQRLLFTNRSTKPEWATAGANVVHSLIYRLDTLSVVIGCPHAQPNDACPHFTSASLHLITSMDSSCFDDLPIDHSTFMSPSRNAGVFTYLRRMYTIRCGNMMPQDVLKTVFCGMALSPHLFTAGNWAICRDFLNTVQTTMVGQSKMMREICMRF